MRRRHALATLPVLILATVLTACGGSSSGGTPTAGSSSSTGGGASGSLTVGAAGFTESNVLAQMYADLLEKAGFTVNVKTVASQEIFQSSLEKGAIAVVPEYAATYANSMETEVTGNQSPTAAGSPTSRRPTPSTRTPSRWRRRSRPHTTSRRCPTSARPGSP